MTTNENKKSTAVVNDETEDLNVADFEDQSIDITSARRHSAWSSDYTDSEEDTTAESRGNPGAVNYTKGSSSSDSEDDEEEDYMPTTKRLGDLHAPMSFTERRAAEELILDRITNHLAGDKLPGILTIMQVNSSNSRHGSVEIDLSSLTPRRLRSVLAYVEACLEEQRGGPKVDVSAYILQEVNDYKSKDEVGKSNDSPPTFNTAAQRRRRKSEPSDYTAPKRKQPKKLPSKRRKKQKTSLIDLLPSVKPVSEQEIIETLDPTSDDDGHLPPIETVTDKSKNEPDPVERSGPISLAEFVSASETSLDSKPVLKPTRLKPTRRKITEKPKAKSFTTKVVQTEGTIAGSRPKRLAALQSMTVVEDLLDDNSEEEKEEDDDDEDEEVQQMLWHQHEAKRQLVTSLETILTRNKDDEDEEEDIDVLD